MRELKSLTASSCLIFLMFSQLFIFYSAPYSSVHAEEHLNETSVSVEPSWSMSSFSFHTPANLYIPIGWFVVVSDKGLKCGVISKPDVTAAIRHHYSGQWAYAGSIWLRNQFCGVFCPMMHILKKRLNQWFSGVVSYFTTATLKYGFITFLLLIFSLVNLSIQ